MKVNYPDWYNAANKDCPNCGRRMCCDKGGHDCGKEVENYGPIHFRGGASLPKITNKDNQINEVEKKQLLQLFLDYGISKISVENGQLKIEYSQKGAEVNNFELEKYRRFIQNLPSHSLSLKDLQSQNNSQTDSPNNNKLAIGLALGAGAVILIGITVYFGRKKVKKNNE